MECIAQEMILSFFLLLRPFYANKFRIKWTSGWVEGGDERGITGDSRQPWGSVGGAVALLVSLPLVVRKGTDCKAEDPGFSRVVSGSEPWDLEPHCAQKHSRLALLYPGRLCLLSFISPAISFCTIKRGCSKARSWRQRRRYLPKFSSNSLFVAWAWFWRVLK